MKERYPTYTEDQIIDLTTLMHNAPGKALSSEFVNYYLPKNDIGYVNNVKRQRGKLEYSDLVLEWKPGTQQQLTAEKVEGIKKFIQEHGVKKKYGGSISTNWLDELPEFQTKGEYKWDPSSMKTTPEVPLPTAATYGVTPIPTSEEYAYYNPPIIKGLTTGDWKQDMVYENPWMHKVPILGDYIKKKAKEIAGQSPMASRSYDDMAALIDPTVPKGDYTGSNMRTFESGVLIKGDEDKVTMLDQYFSEKPLYPKSIYTPIDDYLTFLPSYSIKSNFDKILEVSDNDNKEWRNDQLSRQIDNILIGRVDNDTVAPNEEETSKIYNNFIKTKKPIFLPDTHNSILSDMLSINIASHKIGMGWDHERNLPYMSISDAWDFSPEHYTEKWWEHSSADKAVSYIQSSLMHKAGYPFKIYDRFYFDPKTKKYIPDSKIAKLKKKKYGGSLDLPVKFQHNRWLDQLNS